MTIRTALAVVLFTVSTIHCLGQEVLGPGVKIIGTCAGHESDPGCVLPNMFTSTGLTLFPSPNVPHYAHFTGEANELLNRALGSAIATQLVTLPIISPSSGFTYKFDSASGGFVRSTTSFGPIYAERAETIGRGKLSFGISFSQFHFNKFNGIELNNVPAVFGHIPSGGQPFERDVISTSNNIDLKINQTVIYGTIGLTNRLDVSVSVPIVNVRMGTASRASVIRVSGDPITLLNGITIPNPHQFDNGGIVRDYSAQGEATGIGDVTFRVKGSVYNGEKIRISALADIRAATGDAQKYLGSGSAGIKPFVAISAGSRISPHANFGYQWNGDSVLAGNITGATFGENAAGLAIVTNGPPTKGKLPGNLFYTLGVDIGATKRLTLGFDYLGLTVFDAPQIQATTFATLRPVAGAPATLPNIAPTMGNMSLNNGSAGFKYNLAGRLLVTGNLLFRMDNNGLRQNVTPLVALSYAFGQ